MVDTKFQYFNFLNCLNQFCQVYFLTKEIESETKPTKPNLIGNFQIIVNFCGCIINLKVLGEGLGMLLDVPAETQ